MHPCSTRIPHDYKLWSLRNRSNSHNIPTGLWTRPWSHRCIAKLDPHCKSVQKAFAKLSKGCQIFNSTGTLNLEVQGNMFVDDKNLMHNREQPDNTAEELMTIVTHELFLWDCCIWIIGDLIERLKTEYNLVVWYFQQTGAPQLMPEHELPPNTVVIKHPDYTVTVKHIKETKASKMIGVNTAINQQNKLEWLHLRKKIDCFILTLEVCPAQPHKAWNLYTATSNH
eukprot:11495007-Ditylum_brightwellii.AAC.1